MYVKTQASKLAKEFPQNIIWSSSIVQLGKADDVRTEIYKTNYQTEI